MKRFKQVPSGGSVRVGGACLAVLLSFSAARHYRVTAAGEVPGAASSTATGGLHLVHFAHPQGSGSPLSDGDADDLYQEKCGLCHGSDRTGKPPAFPTLIGVTRKYDDAEITKQIRNGKGRMPAFPGLSDDEVKALLNLLKSPPPQGAPADGAPATIPPPPVSGLASAFFHLPAR